MGWNDLRGFTDYLIRNELVPARYAKFYGMWVKVCVVRELKTAASSPLDAL